MDARKMLRYIAAQGAGGEFTHTWGQVSEALAQYIGYTTNPDGHGVGSFWQAPAGAHQPPPRCYSPPAFANSVDAAMQYAFPPGWQSACDSTGFAWCWNDATRARLDSYVAGAPARALCCCAALAWGHQRGEIEPAGTVRWDVRAFNAAFQEAAQRHGAKAMFIALQPLPGGKEGQFQLLHGGDIQLTEMITAHLRGGGLAV